MVKKAKKGKTAKKAKKAAPKKAATGAKVMSAAAAVTHAAQFGKKYFRSLPEGTWIECDWDVGQQIYDNCHNVPASQVPKAWGGNGP
jgi:hypothetical protein